MIPVEDLEVHPLASDMEVLTDAPMEGESTEEWLMSPLHQEVEKTPVFHQMGALGGWEGPVDPKIVEERAEEVKEDLMTSVLQEQPLLRVAVSGQRCIQTTGALPLNKFHPYHPSAYFLGNLQGLPSTESLQQSYLGSHRQDLGSGHTQGYNANESSGDESNTHGHGCKRSSDSFCPGLPFSGDRHSSTSSPSLVTSGGEGCPRGGIGWSWSFGRRDLS